VQLVCDIVRKSATNLHTKPKAGSIESEHLTSFQNRMWIYDLLLSSWTENMLSIMSKYLENHDGDGVVLYYCFLKHFAGATKANIIAAYAELTEAKVQLHLYNNNVSAFTNAVRIPTCKLVNCQKQPTFQHMLNVYHGVMDFTNTEFSNYVHNLYREYRSDGPAASWSMFHLLDTLDLEYEHLQALNCWEPRQPAKNPEILALTAELSSLKAYVAKLQKSTPESGTPKKPTQPPKEGEKQTTTISGVTWHYCQKCFGGKGAWNKTHTTAEHVKGAGKGYKNVKDANPPTPGQPSVSSSATSAVAQLASVESEPVDVDNTNGLFFCLRLGLFAMLALSQLLRHSVFQAIASYILSFSSTSIYVHHPHSRHVIIAPPLTFCNER